MLVDERKKRKDFSHIHIHLMARKLKPFIACRYAVNNLTLLQINIYNGDGALILGAQVIDVMREGSSLLKAKLGNCNNKWHRCNYEVNVIISKGRNKKI